MKEVKTKDDYGFGIFLILNLILIVAIWQMRFLHKIVRQNERMMGKMEVLIQTNRTPKIEE